jgi:hypothetical protein
MRARAHTHTECLSSLLSAILFSFQYDKSSSLSAPQSPFICWHDAFFPSALSLIEFNTHRNRSRNAPYPNKIPPHNPLHTKFRHAVAAAAWRNQISPFCHMHRLPSFILRRAQSLNLLLFFISSREEISVSLILPPGRHRVTSKWKLNRIIKFRHPRHAKVQRAAQFNFSRRQKKLLLSHLLIFSSVNIILLLLH